MNLSAEVGNQVEGMLGQSEGKLHHSVDSSLPPLKVYVCMYCGDRSAEVFFRVRHVPLVGASLATPNHLMVTFDQQQ